MEKEEKKNPEEIVKKINKIIDEYNNYKDYNVTKESIIKTREELFTRLFNKKEVNSINTDLELLLPNNKTAKLKDYKDLEELLELLDNSKDAFSFLLYEKNRKESNTLDIIGIIFIICFVSLYLVTFKRDRKKNNK